MQHNAPVTVVYVSGGLGSGKSTFTHLCAKHGIKTLNADEIVNHLYLEDIEMVEQIESILGTDIKHPDGSVNKQFIASQIFSNKELRERVESIIHPKVQSYLQNIVSKQKNLVYEIPVLNSKTNLSLADYVVIVEAPVQTRIDRAVARGMTFDDATARIQVQAENSFVPANAIHIANDGTLRDLEVSVEAFLQRVLND